MPMRNESIGRRQETIHFSHLLHENVEGTARVSEVHIHGCGKNVQLLSVYACVCVCVRMCVCRVNIFCAVKVPFPCPRSPSSTVACAVSTYFQRWINACSGEQTAGWKSGLESEP